MKRVALYIITGIAIGVFCFVLIHAFFYSSFSDLTAPSNIKVTNIDYPVHIVIPRLNIDTKVNKVGITASGKMAVPSNYTDTGWYKYGTVPGQKGAAVIAGHVDNGLALPGVFKNLNQLKKGDDIYVTLQNSTTLHFVVQGSKVYDKDAATDEIFNEDKDSLLRLITCTGSWLPTEGTHDQRLVVTAKLKK